MVKIKKYNESYVKIFTDNDQIHMSLDHVFSTYAKGYEFDLRYRHGTWNGRIHSYNHSDQLLPLGLTYKAATYIKHTLKQNVHVDESIFVKADSFSDEYIRNFVVKELKHTKYIPYDYQCLAIREMIYHRRITIECATGSGKSFIMWIALCMIIFHYKKFIKRILLLTPDLGLKTQIQSDFDDYYGGSGKFSEKYLCDYRKKNHKMSNIIHVANYQSLHNKNKKYFKEFDVVIADECHNVSGSEIRNFGRCVNLCTNSFFKFGLCGKVGNDLTLRLNLEGCFGPIKIIKKAHELIEENTLSPFKVIVLTLKYTVERKSEFYKWTHGKNVLSKDRYRMEIEYLNAQTDRREFIAKLASTRNGNTLILVKRKDACGTLIFDLLKKKYGESHRIYYIHGGIKVSERERIRKEVSESENENFIIVATFKTFSVGINLPKLNNLILAESVKSEIPLVQSIGRILRKSKNKDMAILYDINDDLRLSTNHEMNYGLKHLLERSSIYDSEMFDVESTHYELK